MLDADIDGAGDAPIQIETRSTTSGAADLATRLVALPGTPHGALRAEWRRLYRSEPPKRVSRDLLEIGIAWRLQEITGTQWSGPRFFGLEKTERMADGRAAATTATTAATATLAFDAGKMAEASDA